MRLRLRVRVTTRVWGIVLVAVLGLTACGVVGVLRLRSGIAAERAERVRQVVDEAVSVVDGYAAKAAAGQITEAAGQAAAREALASMRFGEDGYVWIMTREPVMVMHPIDPTLDGQSLASRTDPAGTHLFTEMADLVAARGHGYVRYLWPRPGSSDPQPKLSYVRGSAGWGWIVGSGTYVDDITTATVRHGAALGALVVTVLAVLTAMTTLVTVRLRRDVDLVLAAVGALASDDLQVRALPTGRDELGEIAVRIAATRDTLERQRQDLATAQAARERQLQVGYDHQRRAEEQVRERAQQLVNETAGAVLDDLQRLVEQVEAVRGCATRIEDQVATAATVTGSVVSQAKTADRDADALSSSLKDISGMATLIGGVADQTKLLALNATIEAARAGTAGMGFSVVASEVKALAVKTTSSTDQITDTITALRGDAARVGQAIGHVGQEIATLETATTALRDVATEQFELVAHLHAALDTTMAGVQDLAGLGDRLERRAAPRRMIPGTVTLTIGGRQITARLVDLSSSGLRCTGDAAATLPAGTVTDLTINTTNPTNPTNPADLTDLGHPGNPRSPVSITATGIVVRRSGATQPGVGIQFSSLTADAREALRRLLT